MSYNPGEAPLPASTVPGFLANGGEMGALIHSQDWAGTPLGALEQWPQTLKIMLATLLHSPQPMVMGWGTELFSFFNDSYRRMLGSRFSGVLGLPAAEQWPDSWGEIGPIAARALAGQGSHHENMPLTVTRDGGQERTWWTLCFQPFCDTAGHVAGVYCHLAETTEKLRLEEGKAQAQQQQAMLAEVGDLLRDGVASGPMMATAAQKLGHYLHAAYVAYAEAGESGELTQVLESWADAHLACAPDPCWPGACNAALLEALRSGQTVVVSDSTTDSLAVGAPWLAGAGSAMAGAFMISPVLVNGRLAMVLLAMDCRARAWRNVEKAVLQETVARTWAAHQRLLSEQSLRLANALLEQRTAELLCSETALRQSQKLEMMGHLTGGVAHDFNNLLAVINTSVELLCSNRLPPEHCNYYLGLIRTTVERAVKLTGQLLAFARQQPLIAQVFDVDQQVHSVIDLIKTLMGSQVTIAHHPSGDGDCCVLADISQFEIALLNLAVNARDAMGAGGQFTLRVEQVDQVPAGPDRVSRRGSFIAVSAWDTGCGMAPEKLEAIFLPFYTTKAVGKGTGLGLSQVFGFVKQAGGEVAVISEPGSGSVFTLYLPRADRAAELQAPAALAGPDISCEGMGVLVVEDNEDLAQISCEILEVLGYRTVWAASAAAALSLLASDAGRFSLVFSDVVMPGMGGIEFGKQVRRQYPELAVVLTSGYNSAMAGQGDYGFELVLKPYTSDTLARVFRQAIAQHKRGPDPQSGGSS